MANCNPVEVLLEYEGSRKQLSVILSASELCAAVTRELKLFRPGEDLVVSLSGSATEDAVGPVTVYLLQKWSQKWNTFVDVQSETEVKGGDRLCVVPKPGQPQVSTKPSRLQSILARVGKPSGAEAASLTKCFGSKSTGSSEKLDPGSKHKPGKGKTSKVEVVMFSHFQREVPKGDARKRLKRKGLLLDIQLIRTMTPSQVEKAINLAFKHLSHSGFTVLETDSTGHHLIQALVQRIDGQKAVGRRGALYLCEKTDDDERLAEPARKAIKAADEVLGRIKNSGVISIDSSSSSSSGDESLPLVRVRGGGKRSVKGKPAKAHCSNHLDEEQDDPFMESLQSKHLEEFRRIRREQDEAFMESLEIDKSKVDQAEAKKVTDHRGTPSAREMVLCRGYFFLLIQQSGYMA